MPSDLALAAWPRNDLCDHAHGQEVELRPSAVLAANREAVRAIVLAHRVTNPRIFGSIARGDDTTSSDLDLLVDPTVDTTLFDIGAIRHELLDLLGIPVDVVTPKALPGQFRDAVIAGAVPV